MKLRTLATLLIAITLTACNKGHKSVLSSDTSSFSLSSNAVSYVPYDGYYNDLTTWSNGDELKNKLNEISHKTYKALNYTAPNYQTNINADHSYYDFEYLDVIYSDTDVYKNETNKGWQREHAFCASLMCGSLTADAVKRVGRATDFHNLLAAQANANGSRGNKNYGKADRLKDSYQDRTTNEGKDGYRFDATNFEPGDKDKGRVARAIFYMAMMYKDDEVDEINNITMKGLTIKEEPVEYTAGENGAFAIGNLSTLLEWNNRYPVDYLEMQHNISVYKDINTIDGFAQGNRNPFVDYPDLANYVYGDKKASNGELKNIVSSESLLECYLENTNVSHYALKEAKRSYEPGSKIQNDDYKIVKVYKNYNYEVINEGYINSLIDHTFSTEDGASIYATIGAGIDTFKYLITLNPLLSCSSGEIGLSSSGINKSSPNTDQEVTFDNVPFIFNFDTTFVQNISAGGVTFGSGNNSLSKLVIKTKNTYKINAAYIKAFTGNTNSSYRLTIKVGEETLLATTTVNNKDVAKVYGTSISNVLEGQLTYIFEGSSALKINSVAFNEII